MNYKHIFEKFNSLSILIIGDVMIDSYMWGKVERISPEAPVPIVAITKTEDRLGGAANVALNVVAMGAKPILCSVVGDDTKASMLKGLMKEQNMTTDGIVLSKSRKTTVKTRILGHKAQMLRVDEEIDTPLNEKEEKEFIERIENIFISHNIDAVIFQDYDKGSITPFIIENVVNMAKDRKIPVTVDPKKRNFLKYKNVTLFKPNLKELKEGLKIDFEEINEINLIDASLLLQQRLKLDMVFITLSEHGVFIADYTKKQASQNLIPAHHRTISDVSGAGDTVISVATLCLGLKLSSKDVATIANLAGGLVCEQIGVMPINKERLLSELLMLY